MCRADLLLRAPWKWAGNLGEVPFGSVQNWLSDGSNHSLLLLLGGIAGAFWLWVAYRPCPVPPPPPLTDQAGSY